MKRDATSNGQFSATQLLLAVTVLLPFTLVLGVAWLCQAYHRRIKSLDSNATKGIHDGLSGAAASESRSLPLPVCLAA